MFPVARGANGQPPTPPTDASSTVAPASTAARRVGDSRVARVVEMHAHRDAEAGRPADELTHLLRHPDPDRVGEHDLVRAGPREVAGQLQHAGRVDSPLERAAERRPERHGRTQPVPVRSLDDPLAGLDRRLDRGARVALVELLADSEREVHLVERRSRAAGRSPAR